jgi:hypothetical protein
MWREHPVTSWKDATGAQGLERSFWTDVKAKNWSDLEKHIGGNYIVVTPTGRLERAAALERLKRFQLDDFSLGDIETELNGNTMVISYTIALHGSVDGHAFSGEPGRHMTVWQQQSAGWMAIASSITGMPVPENKQ